MPSPITADALDAYVGSYGPSGLSRLRLAQGHWQALAGQPGPGDPSWLSAHAGGRRLYAALEGANELRVYDREPDGGLQLLQQRASGGSGPVHISLDTAGRHALVAHYGSGELALWALDEQGLLAERLALRRTGEAQGQVLPHAHMAQWDPSGRFVLCSDLGLDSLFCWRFDAAAAPTQRLAETSQRWRSASGAGPRHFRFHPRLLQQLYLLNELDSTLVWLRLDPDSGALQAQLRLSSLPAGHRDTSYASDLLISADGRRLYALNRLHDSIAVFALAPDGAPQLLGHEPTRGSFPRSASFSPDGRWLFTCNQRGNSISRFALDESGWPRFQDQLTVDAPASLLLLPALPG
ncbi:lactonase family protein [Paucibacter sp. APW11]|uniref:Lactonase family protein n=1 Tax=Roseateles aquae TaxID=3077235 RepID=A0ABU3PII7_9BURK|nr:lactonase family protein [Paucibacter sp. APW11]